MLEQAGLRVIRLQDVLVLDIEDRPGALADLYARLHAIPEYSSVHFAYLTTRGQIVMGIDPPDQLDTVRDALAAGSGGSG